MSRKERLYKAALFWHRKALGYCNKTDDMERFRNLCQRAYSYAQWFEALAEMEKQNERY